MKVNLKSKLLFFSSLLIITTFVNSGCKEKKDNTNSPLFVLEQMRKDIETGDLKKISTHLCAKDAKKLNTVNGIGELILGSRGKALIDLIKRKLFESHQLDFDHITFKNEQINGTDATVDAYNSKKEKTKTYHFIKEGETWKMCKE